MKIILDAMGGDHAPEAPVLGAIQAAKDFGSCITLVGRGEEILDVLRKNGIANLPEGIEIANAEEIVDMHDDPARVIQKKKEFLYGRWPADAGRRKWRCVHLCWQHRCIAQRCNPDRKTGQGHSPGSDGS